MKCIFIYDLCQCWKRSSLFWMAFGFYSRLRFLSLLLHLHCDLFQHSSVSPFASRVILLFQADAFKCTHIRGAAHSNGPFTIHRINEFSFDKLLEEDIRALLL